MKVPFGCSLFLVLCLFGGVSTGEESRGLDRILETIRKDTGLPALAGAVVGSEGVRAVGAVGFRKSGAKKPVATEDPWHIGSCTKAMTATLMGALVEEGTLSWDSTIGGSFPGLKKKIHPRWYPVTLEQLLTHRSGLPEDRTPDPAVMARLRALTGPLPDQRLRLVERVLADPPSAPPGEKMQYSNFGYVIAGAMAEGATGLSWEELMKMHIFDPLGMDTAGFGAPGKKGSLDQPWGHWNGTPVEPGPQADNPAVLGPAGTVHCSMEDWGKFIALHLAGEAGKSELLKTGTFKKLHTPAGPEGYAMGWIVTPREWAGGTAWTHAGSNNAWFAVTWVAPEVDLAVLVATNVAGDGVPQVCDRAVWELIQTALETK